MKARDIVLPSNRRFGLLIAAVAGCITAYFAYAGQQATAVPIGAIGAASLLAAVAKPDLLLPFNKAWMTLGLFLGRIVSPLVLGLIFYGLITPVAVVLRLAGRDELRLKRPPTGSFWRIREGPGQGTGPFGRQY